MASQNNAHPFGGFFVWGNYMETLKNAIHVTPANRRAIIFLALAIAMTSIHVQAADASEVLPAPPAWAVSTVETSSADMSLAVPPVAASPAPKATKRVWNTIASADLSFVPPRSSEPAVRTMTVPTTAYTSDPGETDASPFTTADGSRVRDGIIAANFLPIGTRVRIPEYFGDKVFEVHDRMNARYTQRVDIWMVTKKEAFNWGIRRVKIEILPS